MLILEPERVKHVLCSRCKTFFVSQTVKNIIHIQVIIKRSPNIAIYHGGLVCNWSQLTRHFDCVNLFKTEHMESFQN